MKLADWAGANLPEGVAVFDYPQARRVRLCTTNGLGRINRELKRRTRVVSMFPNTASCLRLVSALLTGHDEEWMSGKIYLAMKPCNQTPMESLGRFTEKKLRCRRTPDSVHYQDTAKLAA